MLSDNHIRSRSGVFHYNLKVGPRFANMSDTNGVFVFHNYLGRYSLISLSHLSTHNCKLTMFAFPFGPMPTGIWLACIWYEYSKYRRFQSHPLNIVFLSYELNVSRQMWFVIWNTTREARLFKICNKSQP